MRYNPYLSAVKEPANLLSVASVAALSIALLTPLPLILGLVVEAGYLLFVPESAWYRNRISNSGQTPVQTTRKARREALLPTLSPELQERFHNIESVRGQIQAQVANQVTFTPDIFIKLDQLLDQFLESGAKDTQLRAHLMSLAEQAGSAPQHGILRMQSTAGANPARQPQLPRDWPPDLSIRSQGGEWIDKLVARIQASYNDQLNRISADADTDPSLKATLQKRIDILQRRNAYAGKLGQAIKNLDQQLNLVEDSFGLINDEVNSSTPDRVLTEIDTLMQQTDSLTQALREIGDMGGESNELRIA